MKTRLLLLCLALPAAAAAQGPVRYELSFPNAVHREAEVSVTFPDLPRKPLEVRMSQSSPGRYAAHDFAKNVYNVRAFDGRGRPLGLTRVSPSGWTVAGHDGTVRVTYTLFGNRGDGTYAQINDGHARMNMPAALMWARGLERRPARVTFRRPDPSWRVATQLLPTDDPETWTAPDLQYLMDSPVEVGPLEFRSWEMASGGKSYTFRLAVHHRGTTAQVDRFVGILKSLVAEEVGVYGELPAFDFGSYTFIADYVPGVEEDAMEHRNSTVLTGPALDRAMVPNAMLAGHEFFHTWNVERIRPRSLEPFDFERPMVSGELWFAEGFTSYYEALFPVRAGVTTMDGFVGTMGDILDMVLNSPGMKVHSPVEMSMLVPFVDDAAHVDPTNEINTYVSHYAVGQVLALGLDMTLRSRYPGVTLDDFMRAMWQDFGRDQDPRTLAPRRPYTLADLRTTLGKVTGDAAFADDFFRRHVEGKEAIDFATVLAPAGFLLRKAAPGRPSMGVMLTYDDGQAVIANPTIAGRAAYRAGLDQGDRIVSINGRPIAAANDVSAAMQDRKPGDVVPVVIERRGESRTVQLTLGENPRLELVTFEAANRPVTEEIRAFRERLFASRAPSAAATR